MLESITGIAAVIFVFGLIVAIHEFGHMLAAKMCGVAVPDFAIGMGPSLASRVWRGTRYHICAFPIGGFVRIEGLEPEGSLEESSSRTKDGLFVAEGRSWRDANAWQRAFMLLAGPLMNIILGVVFMLLMGFVGFPEYEVRINDVFAGSPAEEAGLMARDVIAEVDGVAVQRPEEVSQLIQGSPGEEVTLTVLRGVDELSLQARPQVLDDLGGQRGLGFSMLPSTVLTNIVNIVETKKAGFRLPRTDGAQAGTTGLRAGDRLTAINGRTVRDGTELYYLLPDRDRDDNWIMNGEVVGVADLEPINITIERDGEQIGLVVPAGTSFLDLGVGFAPLLARLGPWESVQRSGQDSVAMMMGLYFGFRMMLEQGDAASLGGPVTIANVIAQSTKTGAYTFFLIIILINFNLAVFNLLPLPALDGGRLVFVVLNGIGLRVPPRTENAFHAVGMVLLIGLILLISAFDVKGVLNL